MEETKIDYQLQPCWINFQRHIFFAKEGSVQLEVYNEPQGDSKVKAYIYALFVDEKYRGQWLGKKLLKMAEDKVKELGIEAVFLEWDRREAPQWTLEWYERSGYKEVEFGRYNSLLKKDLK